MAQRLPRARTLKGDPKLAYFDSAGGAAGEAPVVLLHGAALRSDDWENIFPRLATRYRVVAYDARGHGRSGRASGYALADLAADAARVLREVAGAPAILIGHSLGGATALIVAAREPALVKALVLEEPWLERYHDGSFHADYYRALQALMRERSDPAALRRAVARLRLAAAGPRGERTVGEVRGFYSAERLAGAYGAVDAAFVDELTRPEPTGTAALREASESLGHPTLLLAADPKLDSSLAEGEARRLQERGADLTRFPGIGHRIHGQRPEPFLEALEPFLRRVRGPSEVPPRVGAA